jgi:hypothetical protein
VSALNLLLGFAIIGLFIVAPIWYAGVLAERRSRSIWVGAWMGFLLGWLGVGIVALMRDKNRVSDEDARIELLAQTKYLADLNARREAVRGHV